MILKNNATKWVPEKLATVEELMLGSDGKLDQLLSRLLVLTADHNCTCFLLK